MQTTGGTGGLGRAAVAAAIAFAVACATGTYTYLAARLPAHAPELRAGALGEPPAGPVSLRGPGDDL